MNAQQKMLLFFFFLFKEKLISVLYADVYWLFGMWINITGSVAFAVGLTGERILMF